jgi:hypothetical protein
MTIGKVKSAGMKNKAPKLPKPSKSNKGTNPLIFSKIETKKAKGLKDLLDDSTPQPKPRAQKPKE